MLGESAVFVKVGSTISLTCEINLYSVPPPDIAWFHGTEVKKVVEVYRMLLFKTCESRVLVNCIKEIRSTRTDLESCKRTNSLIKLHVGQGEARLIKEIE